MDTLHPRKWELRWVEAWGPTGWGESVGPLGRFSRSRWRAWWAGALNWRPLSPAVTCVVPLRGEFALKGWLPK